MVAPLRPSLHPASVKSLPLVHKSEDDHLADLIKKTTQQFTLLLGLKFTNNRVYLFVLDLLRNMY